MGICTVSFGLLVWYDFDSLWCHFDTDHWKLDYTSVDWSTNSHTRERPLWNLLTELTTLRCLSTTAQGALIWYLFADIFWDDIREPSRKLLQYLELTQDVNHWYRFTESSYSGLRESYFWYIRTLPETPFDPIAQSDTIDSSIQLKAWEHAGLLFGAEAGFRLGVKEGPLPSPIIYQLSPGDLQTGPPELPDHWGSRYFRTED